MTSDGDKTRALALPSDSDLMRQRLIVIQRALRFFGSALKSDNDRRLIQRMLSEARDIESATTREFDSPIALLGESGAGKSSLLNALIGLDLLPHNSGSAVTAAICEISGGHTGFKLTVRIQELKAFTKRFHEVWRRLEEAVKDLKDADLAQGARPELDEDDQRLLLSITGRTVEECALLVAKRTREIAAGGAPVARVPDNLFLPEVIEAFRAGRDHVFEYTRDELADLQKTANLYLSASQALWPLVDGVHIQGEFGLLSDGVRLVDLPGLNDPDETRDKIAKAHLQTSKLVWLVLNAKRAATKEIVNYLTESQLLTKLQLNGRLASVAVVVTHADQFDDEAIIKEYRLSVDTPLNDLLVKHQLRLTQVVHAALLKVWDETVRAAGGKVMTETIEAGREILKQIPVFSVDSNQSLLLRGIKRSKKATSFETDEQTGIPALERWILTDFAQRERRVHQDGLLRRIERIESSLRAEFRGRADIKRALAALRGNQGGGVGDIENGARTFLGAKLAEHALEKRYKAEAQAEVVIEAIKSGMADADSILKSEIPDRLNGIHWATLRAIVRRRGIFHGSTRRWDLPEELSEVITKRVVFRWSELFENFARNFSVELESKCTSLLEAHQDHLYRELRFRLGDAAETFIPPQTSGGSLAFEFDLAQAALNQSLETARRRFATSLVDSLRETLPPVFRAAAEETGDGMKNRIIAILTKGMKEIVPVLIPVLSRDLEEQVHEVIRMLLNQVRDVHGTVHVLADRAASNLVADLTVTPEAELHEEISVIEKGLSLLPAA